MKDLVEALRANGSVLLDAARPREGHTDSYLFQHPTEVLLARDSAAVPDLLRQIDHAVENGHYVAGYLAYEAGYALQGLESPSTGDKPVAWFGIYDEPTLLSAIEVEDGFQSGTLAREKGGSRESQSGTLGRLAVSQPKLGMSRGTYMDAIKAIRRLIRDGDVYQINFTTKAHFTNEGDPLALYCFLRSRQRVPYGAYINTSGRRILCCSPELFFERRDHRIATRPMKGTIRRGRTLEEDRQLREQLSSDAKSRAENLMIVDLLRNDLSVVCKSGSVEVPHLYQTETYESVTQMTSTVEGELLPDVSYRDIFGALFPCGSVTGAPKLRAMQRIRELESEPRGPYCGAIGYISPDKRAMFNVAIRTVVAEGKSANMGTGSGIVWDSDPQAEWEECGLKAQFIQPDEEASGTLDSLKLIETMRWENGEIPLLEYHLSRLAESAEYFGYPYQEVDVRLAVDEALQEAPSSKTKKVRLLLGPLGRMEVEVDAFQSDTSEPIRVGVSSMRVQSKNPLLFHKTTRRGVYERAFKEAEKRGWDEALLLNEKGEVTEGTRSNVFARLDGQWVTPPLDCGVLPGVYRTYLLKTRDDVELRPISLAQLRAADELVCCNALRGAQNATLADAAEVAD